MLALWFPVGTIVSVKCNIFRNKPPMYGRKILLPNCTQTHSHARTLTHSLTHPRTHTHTHIHTPYTHTIHTPYTHTIHTPYTHHTHSIHTHTHTHHAHALRHVKYSSTPGIKCGDNRREFCLVPSWCKCTTNMLCTPHKTQYKQWCGWTVGNSAPRCVPFPVLPIWNCILTFSLRSFLPSCYLLLIQIETISLHYDRYISVVT